MPIEKRRSDGPTRAAKPTTRAVGSRQTAGAEARTGARPPARGSSNSRESGGSKREPASRENSKPRVRPEDSRERERRESKDRADKLKERDRTKERDRLKERDRVSERDRDKVKVPRAADRQRQSVSENRQGRSTEKTVPLDRTNKPRVADKGKSHSERNSRDDRDRSSRRTSSNNKESTRSVPGSKNQSRPERVYGDGDSKTRTRTDSRDAARSRETVKRESDGRSDGRVRKGTYRKDDAEEQEKKPSKTGRDSSRREQDVSSRHSKETSRKRPTSGKSRDLGNNPSFTVVDEPELDAAPPPAASEVIEALEQDSKEDEVLENHDTAEAEADPEDEYEDDFEQYESDFESDDDGDVDENSDDQDEEDVEEENKPMVTAQLESSDQPSDRELNIKQNLTPYEQRERELLIKAMKEENQSAEKYKHHRGAKQRKSVVERADSADSGIDTAVSPAKKRPLSPNKNSFINFTSAKQRHTAQKALGKTACRKLELIDSNRINLNLMTFDLFDLPPIDYEAYIKSFGRSNTKQMYCQTKEDELTEEVQTDEIELSEKWTQHPAQDYSGVGGDINKKFDAKELEEAVKSDAARLSSFILGAGEVIVSLLQEETTEHRSRSRVKTKDEALFSDECIRLGELPYRRGSPVTFVRFAPSEFHLMLTIHGSPAEMINEDMDDRGLICVWNIHQPLLPIKVLACSSQPLCGCFSPGKANLVFAGMVDGSVILWDLREPSSMHKIITCGDMDVVLRTPTYSTAEILREESHHSPVMSIRVVQLSSGLGSDVLSDDVDSAEQQLTFRVASLEEYGVVKLWTTVEVNKPDPSGNDTDLGLAPGSRIRLLRNTTINLQKFFGMDSHMKKSLRTLDIQFLPTDANHLFISTDIGIILHSNSQGAKVIPSQYKSESGAVAEVSSFDFKRIGIPCFLVGCSDGNVSLYTLNKDKPHATWPTASRGETILKVLWARNRGLTFYVLDVASQIHIWDLSQSDLLCVTTKEFSSVGSIMSAHLNGEEVEPDTDKQLSMALAFDNGLVEIHQISPSNSPHDELETTLQQILHLS